MASDIALSCAFPEVIDSTIRSSFINCPTQWWRSHIQHLKPQGTNIHLHAGSVYAKGLEIMRRSFFEKGLPTEAAIAEGCLAAINAWGDYLPPEDTPKTLPRVLEALQYYALEAFPLATDSIVPIISNGRATVEVSFAIPLPIKHPDTGNPLLYVGRFDELGQRNNSYFLLDDKTASRLGPTWGQQWELRGQFTGYAWGMREYGYSVAGILVRGLAFYKDGYGHAEHVVQRPSWLIDQWYAQLLRDIHRMLEQYAALQRGQHPDQSFGEACAHYGGCPYRRLCQSHHPDSFIPIYYKVEPWNPLTPSIAD
jgi:hypothetical protein